MRRNEGQKRHSNAQFWTFGRGRLDVKAFSKIKRRKWTGKIDYRRKELLNVNLFNTYI